MQTSDPRELNLVSGANPLYSEEKIKDELNKASVGLSRADVNQVAFALSAIFAGKSINDTATNATTMNPDGSVTTTGDSSRTVSQQTPGIPGAPPTPELSEKSLEALVGMLSPSESAYQLPVADTMTLVASLKAYAVSLEDYYNASYFQSISDENTILALQLKQELNRKRMELAAAQADFNSTFSDLRAAYGPELSFAGNPDERDSYETALLELESQEQALDEATQEVTRLQAELGEVQSITVPYRTTFRVSAAPGWFSQLHQLDALVDIEFIADEPDTDIRIVGAIPAETTQTLDEFEAKLRQYAIALELGGSAGPVAAQTALRQLQASAERLEGLRTNTTFLTEFPGDGDTLRLRFSPAVVPNATRRMLDRTGLNVTALTLVKMPIKDGDIDQLRSVVVSATTTFERGLVLNEEGDYEEPTVMPWDIAHDPNNAKYASQTLTSHVPTFQPKDHLGPLGFVGSATKTQVWATADNAGEALIVTRLTAPKASSKITLSAVPGSLIRSIDGNGASAVVRVGNDVIIHADLPANAVTTTTGKDGKKTTSIAPTPLVLRAEIDGQVVATTIVLGGSPSPAKSSGTPPKKSPPTITFNHGGLKLEIPADKLTPEIADVLRSAAGATTQIIIPGMTLQPAPAGGGTGQTTGSTSGGGTATPSKAPAGG